MQDLIAKANTLLEALPYIQKFSGETFVVKYGGSFMDSPDADVRTSVARDIIFLEAVEINPVVVHGGGKAITRAMERAGLKADFIQGQRVTDEATAKIVDDVLSREINPEIVKTIKDLGGQPVGFAGRDIFKCRRLWLDDPENPGKKIDIGSSAKSPRSTLRRSRNPSGAASRQSSARPRAARTGKFTTATRTLPPRNWPLRSRRNGSSL